MVRISWAALLVTWAGAVGLMAVAARRRMRPIATAILALPALVIAMALLARISAMHIGRPPRSGPTPRWAVGREQPPLAEQAEPLAGGPEVAEPTVEPSAAETGGGQSPGKAIAAGSRTARQPRGVLGAVAWALLRAAEDAGQGEREDSAGPPAGPRSPAARSATNAFAERKATSKPAEPGSLAAPTATAEGEKENPAGAPAWVGAEPHRQGNQFLMAVAVGPYAELSECEAHLPEKLNRMVDQYASRLIGPDAVGRVRLPMEYLRRHVILDRWVERKQYAPPLGEMVTLHVLLGFDSEAKTRVIQAWRKAIVAERLVALGAGVLLVLLLLAVVYGYLKIDLATGGAYRGRLRLAAGALLAVLIAGAVLLVRS